MLFWSLQVILQDIPAFAVVAAVDAGADCLREIETVGVYEVFVI